MAAAVCPHPPLLVPEVAAGAAAELDDLRAVCLAALDDVVGLGVERLVVVGGGADLHTDPQRAAGGSLRRFGIDIHAGDPEDDSLPLSLTIGAWLLDQTRAVGGAAAPRGTGTGGPRVEYVGLGDETPAEVCAGRLARIVAGPDRVGVLAMADLSAKLSEHSPGYVDPRAQDFDDVVVAALSSVDLPTLVGLDADLARELWCSGVPALAALAGAARTTDRPIVADPRAVVAPYGVGYVVVSWMTA